MKAGIYALKDPDTDEIRYIGRSKNIGSRYRGHIAGCKTSALPSGVWIAELLKNGKKPALELLQEHCNPIQVEEQWISWGRKQGFNLLNIASGGYKELEAFKTTGVPCLQADGKRHPTKMYRDFYFSFTRSTKVARRIIRQMKNQMSLLKMPEEKIKYEIWVASQIVRNSFWSDKHKQEIYDWAHEVQPKVEKFYPGLMVIAYE
jgi:hypothetical protein